MKKEAPDPAIKDAGSQVPGMARHEVTVMAGHFNGDLFREEGVKK
ncbi:hypothetical protein ACYCLF_10510 [Bacillus velezensis]|nr:MULTISPECIES: hypothetical protein [Bacillus amyloliquefaciens group]